MSSLLSSEISSRVNGDASLSVALSTGLSLSNVITTKNVSVLNTISLNNTFGTGPGYIRIISNGTKIFLGSQTTNAGTQLTDIDFFANEKVFIPSNIQWNSGGSNVNWQTLS